MIETHIWDELKIDSGDKVVYIKPNSTVLVEMKNGISMCVKVLELFNNFMIVNEAIYGEVKRIILYKNIKNIEKV